MKKRDVATFTDCFDSEPRTVTKKPVDPGISYVTVGRRSLTMEVDVSTLPEPRLFR
jgi:hypothetical protein